jgi:hypothetical protein
MTNQFQLDFDSKLPVSAQIGMAQADLNAEPRWKREIDGCILAVARRLQEFTVDNVLEEIEALPHPFETHNLAALGPRMKEVSKTLKYMVATDRVQRSKRPASHGNFLRVWESKVRGRTE